MYTILSFLALAYFGLVFILVPLFALPASIIFGIKPAFRFYFKLFTRIGFAVFGCRVELTSNPSFPKNKPVILLANHPGYFDPVLINIALPGFYSFVLFGRNFKNPLLLFTLLLIGAVQRKFGDKMNAAKTILDIIKSVNAGDSFVLFPSEFVDNTGGINKVEQGIYTIIEKTNAQVFPVYFSGGTKFGMDMRPFTSKIVIGQAYDREILLSSKDEYLKQSILALGPNNMLKETKPPTV
jgi:1-acyl-sn-glycerol-3-phosphate acyltransferase